MLNLNEKKKLMHLIFKWFLYNGKKKHKTNYYAKKMSGKSWVSLQYELEVSCVNSNAKTLFP